jgi:hypothetical protein
LFEEVRQAAAKGQGQAVNALCQMTGLSRASYYRWRLPPPSIPVEMELRDAMQQIALQFPAYGYRRITAELNRRGFAVNHKRVLRLMRQDNLLCLRHKAFVVTTDSRHNLPVYANLARDLVPQRVNQLWVADITYIRRLLKNNIGVIGPDLLVIAEEFGEWEESRRPKPRKSRRRPRSGQRSRLESTQSSPCFGRLPLRPSSEPSWNWPQRQPVIRQYVVYHAPPGVRCSPRTCPQAQRSSRSERVLMLGIRTPPCVWVRMQKLRLLDWVSRLSGGLRCSATLPHPLLTNRVVCSVLNLRCSPSSLW